MMAYLKSIFLLLTILNAILTFEQNGTVPLINKQFEIKYFGRATWFNAHLSCLACGARLASIESAEEETHVAGLISDLGLMNERFWIAGTDLANEGIFN
ncbi:hypothetical protein HA402_013472 [Bradysia odoriphaga]|nr:hypothetical protein HA402_013472 [Bradysia odoriphaga]